MIRIRGFSFPLITATALFLFVATASAEPRADSSSLAEVSADAKKAVDLLESAKATLERATVRGDHRQKALESIGSALAAISGVKPASSPPTIAENGDGLAADSKLTSALKLLVAAKAAVEKAGASYASAKPHVEAAIGHVKAAIAAG